MERMLVVMLALAGFALWVGLVVWIIKRFRKTWEALKSGQLNVLQGQAGAPPPFRAVPEQPKTNPMGIVTETLDESLAKHRKKVQQELAELLKQQSR